MLNQVCLQARVIEVKPLRFTPAGIPIQELMLEHCSEALEAGHSRKVEFVIAACAIGEVSQSLQNMVIGTEIRVEGFLALARKNSSRLVLHIQRVQIPATISTSITV